MKKRILLIALVLCMVVSLCSCSVFGHYDKKYAYSSIQVNEAPYEIAQLKDSLDFVYDETFLKLSDDGTWCIDMNIILFINSNIDEGTYTMDGDTYVFEGFEYGMDARGYETEEGFDICFYWDDVKALTLTFVED